MELEGGVRAEFYDAVADSGDLGGGEFFWWSLADSISQSDRPQPRRNSIGRFGFFAKVRWSMIEGPKWSHRWRPLVSVRSVFTKMVSERKAPPRSA